MDDLSSYLCPLYFAGNQQFTNILTYFWLACVISCVSVQLVYLNKVR